MPKRAAKVSERIESEETPAVEESEASAAPTRPARRATAETMASRQREISVSEFFTKNRHLLGFDNPAKALLTTVKEAVDNSLDACEEAGILPELIVEVKEVGNPTNASGASRFRVSIEDNGPGIVKPQIAKIFAKLLYGSKFHRLKQSRGQQGIGISAAGLYGQLTTGRPVVIISKIGKGRPAHRIELRIDTKRNHPDVLKDEIVEWDKEHGTRVEIELVAAYRGGRTGVEAYLEQTVVANPHLGLTFHPPKGEVLVFPRVANELPREAEEIKPHPHGVELGMLLRMLHDSPGKSVKQVLIDDFSRISPALAEQVCELAKVKPKTSAASIVGDDVDRLHKALGEVKVKAPSASCVVPIGEDLLIEGLKRRFKADFYVSTTRPPSVYRGNPFVVEVGLAYGGELPNDDPADVMRFANRVPLQYQPKACAISEAIYDTNWRSYELQQPRGALPLGPLAVVVHLASVWVPFTSEAKEAVAHYDELLREMKLAVQECGRKLGAHLRARERAVSEQKRLHLFQRYIPEVAEAIGAILSKPKDAVQQSFYSALPNFVRMAQEQPEKPDGEGSPGGSEPPPAANASEPPPPPKAAAKKAPAKKPAAPAKAAAPAAKAAAPAAKAAPAKAAAAKEPAKKAPPAAPKKGGPLPKKRTKPELRTQV
ncbi:DNA topoisomerase VI subunit B [Pendulispora rubella]|uniref:Type 2 DNA topoisomerase 6 subunit B n=1 Tax=Pendulispora rubella TaxID=2741070 RepID=A0ABZ2LME5_9BACT